MTHLVFRNESSSDVRCTLVRIPSLSAFPVVLHSLESDYEHQELVFPIQEISNFAQLLRALDDSGLLCMGKK